MRLGELSKTAGVPPTTVKWYLRSGLLHRGDATAANQAHYDDTHVRRLRLIRALVEIGGLSTDSVSEILAAVDGEESIPEVLAVAHDACAPRPPSPGEASMALVDDYLCRRHWQVRADSGARRELAAALTALAALGDSTAPDVSSPSAVAALLDPYADAVERLAEAEIAHIPDDLSTELLIEQVVAGTVLLEHAMAALRRMAQENFAAQRYGEASR